MVQIDDKKFHAALDELRDLLNWLQVIQKEYHVTEKDIKTTRTRLTNAVKHLQDGMK